MRIRHTIVLTLRALRSSGLFPVIILLGLLLGSCRLAVAPRDLFSVVPNNQPTERITPQMVRDAFTPLGARDFRAELPAVDDSTCAGVLERWTFAIPAVAPAGGVLLYCGSDRSAADAAARFAKQRPTPAHLSVRGHIVLRLADQLAPDEAEQYRAALERLS